MTGGPTNPPTQPEKRYYTWSEFDADVRKIAEWARPFNFKSVYGVPRGGLIVAVAISHLLDILLVMSHDDITRDTLVVDDIVDKGDTMKRLLVTVSGKIKVASIFFHEDSCYRPHFFAQEKKDWVVFPWETEASSRYDGTKA